MPFSEDDLLPISALQHLLYCPRQCALIHIERLWAENRLTVEGRQLHRKADAGKNESRRPRDGEGAAVRIARSVPLRSNRLGLFGVADVVEFYPTASAGGPDIPRPVEFKRGRPKTHDADRVQLCAQAICLEEMVGGITIAEGDLFYGKTRRRLPVAFDDNLRALTQRTAERLHELIASGRTPAAIYEKNKCERCSLLNLCLPTATDGARSANRYLDRTLRQLAIAGAAPPDD